MTLPDSSVRKKSYSSFAAATAVYVAGGTAFFVWSYLGHRADLYHHVDQTLTMAAYAVLEIPEASPPAEPSVEPPRTDRLQSYAANTDLAVLGTVQAGAPGAHLLYTRRNSELEATGLLKQIAAEAARLAEYKQQNIILKTLSDKKAGRYRFAILNVPSATGPGRACIAGESLSLTNKQLKKLVLQRSSAAVFLLLTAIVLAILFSRARNLTSAELSALNERLQLDVELLREREEELRDAIRDLERFSSVASGRESRIIELKNEVNELRTQMNRPKKYNIDRTD